MDVARKLSHDEIENILKIIQPNPHIPAETGDIIVKKTRENLRLQLTGKKIFPKMIGKLREEIERMYSSTIIQPGESVGIITAQSIGEKQRRGRRCLTRSICKNLEKHRLV